MNKPDDQPDYPHTENDGICHACGRYQPDTMSFAFGLQMCPAHATERFGNAWWGGEDGETPEPDMSDPNNWPYWLHQ